MSQLKNFLNSNEKSVRIVGENGIKLSGGQRQKLP